MKTKKYYRLIAVFVLIVAALLMLNNITEKHPSTEEKIKLLSTSFGFPIQGYDKPSGTLNSAGFNAGLIEYGIPPLQEVDSGMGVANPGNLRKGDNATALPSTTLIASTFSKEYALEAGNILGREAKDKGFNIVLAGGVNLIREPRNGRNFEYSSEDPLLSGVMTGYFVKGVQSNNVVSTIKHFALNAQETGRVVLNAVISEKNMRESDLLAFEIANEIGKPGSVMTAYNKVNGQYAAENDFLINQVLKKDWKFKGWVMSDWGGTHSTEKSVNAGLDQQSGFQYDDAHYYGQPLLDAVKDGRVSEKRINDMFSRIVSTLEKYHAFSKNEKLTEEDYLHHRFIAEKIAGRGIVLLKNDGVLPFSNNIKKILVIGGHADKGVLSGAGASQVIPPESFLLKTAQGIQVYHPSSIVDALHENFPNTSVVFYSGQNIDKIGTEINTADAVVVVANQWGKETKDHLSLTLPDDQNSLITSIAQMNDNVVVVLQTGGPIKMPWNTSVKAILEAWYSGIGGGQAISDVLVGKINPSGRLPVTFPLDESDLPHPMQREWSTTTSSPRIPKKGFFDVDYNVEGANVGYKWFVKKNKEVLYPFGFGLSYSSFEYNNFSIKQDKQKILKIEAIVKNTGDYEGVDTPQIYLHGPGKKIKLVSWTQISLLPGQGEKVQFDVDPRLLSEFDVNKKEWKIDAGKYTFCLSKFAGDCSKSVDINFDERVLYKYN